MNALDHFRIKLMSLPVERLNALTYIEVRGPQPQVAVAITRVLRDMVADEYFRRILVGAA